MEISLRYSDISSIAQWVQSEKLIFVVDKFRKSHVLNRVLRSNHPLFQPRPWTDSGLCLPRLCLSH